jgi:acyl phosphate:glycerol-3-phosphate acyltransferase
MTIHPVIMIAIGFLSGSIPFGWIIGRLKGVDVRKHGSGNIGATNLGRLFGFRYFLLCFVLDVLKGLLPTLAMGWTLGRLGDFEMPARDALWWLGGMAAPVLGHIFSPWLKFKGGKGVATGLGALLGVFPVLTIAGGAAFGVWLVVFAIGRYVSLASLVAGLCLPLIVLAEALVAQRLGRIDASRGVVEAAWPFLAMGFVLAALVGWTHRANIRRLRAGTELRAFEKPPERPAPRAD